MVMLYALPQEKITKLRNLSFRPEFTGAEMLFAVFRSEVSQHQLWMRL
jgi:hypothetical protein